MALARINNSTAQTHARLRCSPCTSLTGRIPNVHSIVGDPLSGQFFNYAFRQTGLSELMQRGFEEAKKNDGIAQAFLGFKRILFVTDPDLIKQLSGTLSKNLQGHETGGVQEKFFGKGTLVSLATDDPLYQPTRHRIAAQVYGKARAHTDDMQQVIRYVLTNVAEQKQPTHYENLGSQIALRIIAKSILGIHDFPEQELQEFITITNNIMRELHTIKNTVLVSIENFFGNKVSFTPQLDQLKKQGEEILKRIISKNSDTLLVKMKALTGNFHLVKEDLFKRENMGLMELILVGGFETTGKSIRDALIFLQQPENLKYVTSIKNVLDKITQDYKKQPNEWNQEDVTRFLDEDPSILEPVLNVCFETLRLRPPFYALRNSVLTTFNLTDDIQIPKGTIIIKSLKDAHAAENSGFGKDAAIFNPDRWNRRNKNLNAINNVWDGFKYWIGSFLTFGNDQRVCPGRRLSMQELILTLSNVLYYFELRPSPDTRVNYSPGFTLSLTPDSKPIGFMTPVRSFPQPKVTSVTDDEALQSSLRLRA